MTGPALLGGRYELGGRIGRGGMADVHRGVDVRLGREVAVKVLRADLARDPSFQARFRREAQAAASLSAPSIVAVYDTGQDASGVPWIVMELVEGRTLRQVLDEEGRLLPQRALEVTADICAALAVAHRAGIVHRDIKPGNVMLTPSGAVKVMDFGIARAAADAGVTQTAAIVGTAAYLSPEQARGEHVDERSDLYSTGCLLYELLTGTPPFTGDSAVAVAYQHVREDPAPPSDYDPALRPDLDAVVLKAMAKNPENRYQSAAEMRDDVARAAAGEPVQATPVLEPVPTLAPAAVVAPPREPDRGRRGLVLGLFGLLLLGVAVAVALLVRGVLGTESDLVPAPDVVGVSQQEAVLRLADAGLRVGEVVQEFSEQPVGTVLRQTPPADIVVPRGGTVDLVVSEGVEMTIVPAEVVGRGQDEAEVLLASAKLAVERVVTRDGNLPAGRVLEVVPPPGTQVPAGSGVVLTVASGQVEVPDVRGQAQDAATAALQQAGFSVAVELRPVEGTAPGTVLDQSPVNRTAPRGSAVTIVVAQEPPPPSPTPTEEPTPTASPTPTGSPTASPSPSPSPTS